MSVAVISIDGKPLMPTGNGKARHLLKDGKAKIYKRNRLSSYRGDALNP